MSSNSAWFIASTINRVCKQEALIWKYELVFRKREYNGKHQKILSCNGQKRPLLTNCLSLGTVATCFLRSRDASFTLHHEDDELRISFVLRTSSGRPVLSGHVVHPASENSCHMCTPWLAYSGFLYFWVELLYT